MLTPNLSVNADGHLTFGGADCVSLAEQYQTPLYVMDENTIRQNCRGYRDALMSDYDGKGLICFASKAFSCKEIYRIVNSEGLGTDVVSGGELYTALQAGMPAKNIVFHGNSKSNSELEFAVKAEVGRIVCDNLPELARLNRIAATYGKTVNVMLRIKPGIDAHTHNFIQTGQIDSKFGFALETGEAKEAVLAANAYENLNLVGLHCHIGSQILDTAPFAEAARVMLHFMDALRAECGIVLHELNLGGGPGIKYVERDDPKPFGDVIRAILGALHETCAACNYPEPFVLFEPGRSIVGAAGLTLYTVMAKKQIPNVRTYVLVDGGMCDNLRYALYQAEYEVICANRAGMAKEEVVTVGGKCCETGDLIGEGMPLQSVEPDDILAVLATGAYNYSMSSNYNRNAKPAVVMVKDGEARVIVKRETYADVCKNDI